MITILHGDDFVSSRNELVKLKTKFLTQGEVLTISSENLNLEALNVALLSPSLFANQKTVVIENLFNLKSPKLIKEITALILESEPYTNILLWIDKLLTKTQLGMFKNAAKSQEFVLPKLLFKFLDNIFSPHKGTLLKMLADLKKNQSSEFIFLMLVRQIRLLLALKKGTLNMPSWMEAKLKRQAQMVSEEQLLESYKNLLHLDTRMKTSRNILSLDKELDLLILKL